VGYAVYSFRQQRLCGESGEIMQAEANLLEIVELLRIAKLESHLEGVASNYGITKLNSVEGSSIVA